MSIITVAILPIKEGRFAEAVQLMRETAPESHKEPGIERLAFHRSEKDESLLVAVESYRDQAAIDAHGQTPHLIRVRDTLPHILGGPLEIFRCDAVPMGDPVMGRVTPAALAGRAPSGLVVLSMFTVKEGTVDKVLALLEEDAIPTHKEPGVHRFAVNLDISAPRHIVVVEAYTNAGVLEAHYKTPHLAKVARELPPLLESANRIIRLTPLGIGDPDKGML